MKIHPAADLFPMMTEEELQELAADIAANGLLHPIIVDDEKQLIDGRNRLAACKIAQVEPRFERLNGHDPLAYIVSANLERRNLNKGQRAMLAAMIYPEGQQGRGKNAEARKAQVSGGFSAELLRQARSVFRHSQELAQSVVKGSVTLDAALAQVQEAKRQADSTEAKHARLRTEAPDLAVRVAEENLELDEALTILHERELELRRTKEAGHTAARYIFHFAGHVASIHSAIAAGEDIRIPPDTMKTLRDALLMLEKDMQRK
jgi:hypothetical protein